MYFVFEQCSLTSVPFQRFKYWRCKSLIFVTMKTILHVLDTNIPSYSLTKVNLTNNIKLRSDMRNLHTGREYATPT